VKTLQAGKDLVFAAVICKCGNSDSVMWDVGPGTRRDNHVHFYSRYLLLYTGRVYR
jgi:hypothetical protein